MLGLSDRDSKIILLLLIIAIVALPYVLYTKGLREETEIIKGENVTLQTRLEELQEMNKNRDFYIAETERMKKERDDLIASFPAEIDTENYTMFLNLLEINSLLEAQSRQQALLDDDDDDTPRYGYEKFDGNTEIWFSVVGFGENEYTAISDETSEDPLSGVINDSTLTFSCKVDGIRYLLNYIKDYEDPMIYRNLTLEFDPGSGRVDGKMMLEQYAIAGRDRKLEPVAPIPDLDELDLRGIEEFGVFGPMDKASVYTWQLYQYILENWEEEEDADDVLDELIEETTESAATTN